MSAWFYQVPETMIAPDNRDRGFRFQFNYNYMGNGHWMDVFEAVAEWYDENFDDPEWTRVDGGGLTLFFKDENTAFEFKMRFC
jgi:hypothetical protein